MRSRAIIAGLAIAAGNLRGQEARPTSPWWPEKGAVILGGGALGDSTFDQFARKLIALAGGPDAPIVIIPTANEAVAPRLRGDGAPFDPVVLVRALESKGATHVSVIHTRSHDEANSAEFVKALREAKGVWIPGGGARILENTYRGTLLATELRGVIERGGVLAGDSAGSIALGCFMLGWTPDPWGIVVDGMNVLPRMTVVPHASAARGYVPWEETLTWLMKHPGPVGVVVDENTAVVITQGSAEVIGKGNAVIIDPGKRGTQPVTRLMPGVHTLK